MTSLYDATGKQGGAIHRRLHMDSTGAGLFIGVSLLLQGTTRQASRGGGAYSWASSHGQYRGGAIHWRVFVTTVYDTTGIEGAGLFISVSLLLQYYYSVRRDRQAGGWLLHGRVFTWSVKGAGLFIGVSLLLQGTTRQASRGGRGLFMGVFTWTVQGRGYSLACLCYHSVRHDRH